jgi:hypothetical protein
MTVTATPPLYRSLRAAIRRHTRAMRTQRTELDLPFSALRAVGLAIAIGVAVGLLTFYFMH